MFALIPYFCLWVSVVWHLCSMWIIVSRWLLQRVQVGGVVFFDVVFMYQLGITGSQACDNYSFFPVVKVWRLLVLRYLLLN